MELQKSKNILSDILNTDIKELAFPIGKFNQNTIKHCLDVGFSELYSGIPGSYFTENHYINRSLAQDLDEDEFQVSIMGGYDIFKFHYTKLASL